MVTVGLGSERYQAFGCKKVKLHEYSRQNRSESVKLRILRSLTMVALLDPPVPVESVASPVVWMMVARIA
jgi:hypothetical protein